MTNMKKYWKILTAAAIVAAVSCTPEDKPGNENENNQAQNGTGIERTDFAKGADISWVTQMESEGSKFYNSKGEERECTALMKEIGMNAIRLRVWVNPEGGWNGKEDVLAKALRAKNLGMKLMIDFHYSDTWADPAHQTPPAAWASYNAGQMADAAAAHTKDVLETLAKKGVEVDWVQIGNEVNTGMLWSVGEIRNDNALNFKKIFNAASAASREVYPDAKVILHLSNGHDASLYSWFFNLMKIVGADYDMIGMSLYPMWWENGGWNKWKTPVDSFVANMKSLVKTYGKPVMLCETGARVHEPEISKEVMQYVLDQTRTVKECHGVFYWEPQAPKGYNDGYEMGAFADGKPTVALDPFKN